MLGREAYHRPFVLAELHYALYPEGSTTPSREELLDRIGRYAERALARGDRLSAIARHVLGLYGGVPGARIPEGGPGALPPRDPDGRAPPLARRCASRAEPAHSISHLSHVS